MRILTILFICLSSICYKVQSQRFFSLTANVSGFSMTPFATGGTTAENNVYTYKGSTNYSLNARFFAKRDIPLRIGLGMNSISYQVNGGSLATTYDVHRQDTKGIIGTELHIHPDSKNKYTFYPGIFVPITWTGGLNVKDMTTDVKNAYKTGNLRAGLGLNAGLNMRVLRIIRIGVEADCLFDRAVQAYSDLTMYDYLPIQELRANLYGTVGLSF